MNWMRQRSRALGNFVGACALLAVACSDPAYRPPTISIVAGNNQTAPAGQPVSVIPVVKVADGSGAPWAGVTVTFSVGLGGGVGGQAFVTGSPATTNADGLASPMAWILGSAPGP